MSDKNNSTSDEKQNHLDGGMLAIGIVIGLCLGAGIGVGFDNVALGAGLGLMFGVSIGVVLDYARKDQLS